MELMNMLLGDSFTTVWAGYWAVVIICLVLGIGCGIVALVCGILGLVRKNMTLSIVGIVFGVISLGGIGIAGLICGIIGCVKSKKPTKTT